MDEQLSYYHAQLSHLHYSHLWAAFEIVKNEQQIRKYVFELDEALVMEIYPPMYSLLYPLVEELNVQNRLLTEQIADLQNDMTHVNFMIERIIKQGSDEK